MKRRWLVLSPDTRDERLIPLDRPTYQVGRGSEATLRVPSRNVSGLHASLVLREQCASIVDLDSTNGTVVNGKKVRSVDLHDGDTVELADMVLVFHEEEVPEPVALGRQETETYVPAFGGFDSSRLGEVAQAAVAAGFLTSDEADALVSSWEILQGSARRLDALHAVVERALRVADRPRLIRTILTEIGSLLHVDVIGLYLCDEGLFHILEGGKYSSEVSAGSVSETLLDKVLSTGEPQMLENIGQDSSVLGFESLMQMRIQSLLCLPVLPRSGRVTGALYCVSRRSGELCLVERDRLFLTACSSVIAVALENLRVREVTKERAKAEERSTQQRRFSPVIHRLQQEKENLSLKLRDPRASELFGMEHGSMQELNTFVQRSARTDVPVLLLGETGVGKTALARHIHELSRSGTPFVTVDCMAIAAELVESELFGHEKGAFTGAYFKKAGKVAAAESGTVFIDEIGDLNPRLQGKLLRLIESGEFEPVGSTRTQRCSARLIFATNKELAREVESRNFRQDLYFRLNVLNYTIPPLRVRRELILPLAEHFLQRYSSQHGRDDAAFTDAARAALVAHRWPGNIRELENAIMRALINSSDRCIDVEHLEISEHSTQAPRVASESLEQPQQDLDLKSARERLDREFIGRALALSDSNVSQAARRLNLSRNSLMDLIKKYGMKKA
jgi:transcriptional regulator with GAF, ATPase, and Fis domain